MLEMVVEGDATRGHANNDRSQAGTPDTPAHTPAAARSRRMSIACGSAAAAGFPTCPLRTACGASVSEVPPPPQTSHRPDAPCGGGAASHKP
jgi:hypothetical protein